MNDTAYSTLKFKNLSSMIENIKDWDNETQARVDKGVGLFMKGYNCTQAVAMTFADLYGIPEPLMSRLAASLGGGMSRMRLTCGTASGIFLLAGLEVTDFLDSPHGLLPEDYTPYPDMMVKKKDYEVVQALAQDFKKANGSISCAELLAGAGCKSALNPSFVPDERNQEYYRKRPCARLVASAITIYMNYLKNKYAPV